MEQPTEVRVLICPVCHRVSSIAPSCSRPICVHAWVPNGPEIWDGDDTNGEGRRIEEAPAEHYRTSGPRTWSEMVPFSLDQLSAIAEDSPQPSSRDEEVRERLKDVIRRLREEACQPKRPRKTGVLSITNRLERVLELLADDGGKP